MKNGWDNKSFFFFNVNIVKKHRKLREENELRKELLQLPHNNNMLYAHLPVYRPIRIKYKVASNEIIIQNDKIGAFFFCVCLRMHIFLRNNY